MYTDHAGFSDHHVCKAITFFYLFHAAFLQRRSVTVTCMCSGAWARALPASLTCRLNWGSNITASSLSLPALYNSHNNSTCLTGAL